MDHCLGSEAMRISRPEDAKRASLRFLGLFVLFVVAFSLFLRFPWIDDHVVGPYTEFIATVSGAVLRLIVQPVQIRGTMILHELFAVDIRRGCDGVVASILLLSACLAYPMNWRSRALGGLFGYLLIFGLNLVRIVGLFVIGLKASRPVFEFFHTYVAQFAVIALAMVFWIFWIGRERRDRA